MQINEFQIQEYFRLIELPPEENPLRLPHGDISLMQNRMKQFKIWLKKQKKVLAKKYHPDLPKNKNQDPNHFKRIMEAIQTLEKLQIAIPQRPVIHIYKTYTVYPTSPTSSTTSYSSTSYI